MVEHLTLNQVVQGSRPWRCTPSTVFAGRFLWGWYFFCAKNEPCGNRKISSRWELAHILILIFLFPYGECRDNEKTALRFSSMSAWLIYYYIFSFPIRRMPRQRGNRSAVFEYVGMAHLRVYNELCGHKKHAESSPLDIQRVLLCPYSDYRERETARPFRVAQLITSSHPCAFSGFSSISCIVCHPRTAHFTLAGI